jgi:hypothetical protein
MRLRLGTLRAMLAEVTDPKGEWLYFHITHSDMGPTFTFEPRLPSWNENCEAEDFTTPRVSLASSVEKAIHGKFGSPHPTHFGQHEMFVYASRAAPKLLIPRGGADLDDPKNRWGNDWSYSAYAAAHGLDPDDKRQHAQLVRGRVSDDPTITKEVWSLAPIKMILVGRIWPDDARQPTKILQKNLLKIAEPDDEEPLRL